VVPVQNGFAPPHKVGGIGVVQEITAIHPKLVVDPFDVKTNVRHPFVDDKTGGKVAPE
jgi:hypothetical protein